MTLIGQSAWVGKPICGAPSPEMNPPRQPTVFLFDNGSLRAESTLSLRRLAKALADRTGREVRAVSLLHSDKVPAAQLGGTAAELLRAALDRFLTGQPDGAADVVPLFFGPSAAVTIMTAGHMRTLRERFPHARLRLAPWLVNVADAPDQRIAKILADQVRVATQEAGWERPKVLLTDHGSPSREVTAVRDFLANQLRTELAHEAAVVGAAAMERRDGPEYDFNEPLLERALRTPPFNNGNVIVALQFLSPGRHAGPDGDVAQICRAAERESIGLQVRLTEPIAINPLLVEVLADRLNTASKL